MRPPSPAELRAKFEASLLAAKEGRLHVAFSLLAETLIDVMLRLELEQMEASQPEQMESSWPASGETEPTEPNT